MKCEKNRRVGVTKTNPQCIGYFVRVHIKGVKIAGWFFIMHGQLKIPFSPPLLPYCWIEKEKRFINVGRVKKKSREVKEVWRTREIRKEELKYFWEGPGFAEDAWRVDFIHVFLFPPSYAGVNPFFLVYHTHTCRRNILHPISVEEKPLEKPFLISKWFKVQISKHFKIFEIKIFSKIIAIEKMKPREQMTKVWWARKGVVLLPLKVLFRVCSVILIL